MSGTDDVKNIVTYQGTIAGWAEALRDAEVGLEKAQRAVASWKATVRTCRRKLEKGEPWPETQSSGQTENAAT